MSTTTKRQRVSTGGAYQKRGANFLRVTVAPQTRRSERLPWVSAEQWAAHAVGVDAPCECAACRRARDVQTMVTVYREARADDEPFLVQPNGARIRVDGLANRSRASSDARNHCSARRGSAARRSSSAASAA